TPAGQIGIKIENPLQSSLTEDAFLFSESQSRVVVSLDKMKLKEFEKVLNKQGMEYHLLGKTGGDSLVAGNLINIPIKEAFFTWDTGFTKLLTK
ncbi:MAG: hypothetical protein GWO07_03550, partial [Candidatus Dadabacteria bacterium]|nr:hypothetical protein [Candidatus Dadabacteria bacterium]NIS07840.1 hypothetical protein [Candidatus Dadabacteria bacterium]NIY21594.1 hypothetical protein [Candidatus Dadabacteria bacterium]